MATIIVVKIRKHVLNYAEHCCDTILHGFLVFLYGFLTSEQSECLFE